MWNLSILMTAQREFCHGRGSPMGQAGTIKADFPLEGEGRIMEIDPSFLMSAISPLEV
jgi:hypothetical protein